MTFHAGLSYLMGLCAHSDPWNTFSEEAASNCLGNRPLSHNPKGSPTSSTVMSVREGFLTSAE